MKITSTFEENGKTLQEIMEQFLIIYFNENIDWNALKIRQKWYNIYVYKSCFVSSERSKNYD